MQTPHLRQVRTDGRGIYVVTGAVSLVPVDTSRLMVGDQVIGYDGEGMAMHVHRCNGCHRLFLHPDRSLDPIRCNNCQECCP